MARPSIESILVGFVRQQREIHVPLFRLVFRSAQGAEGKSQQHCRSYRSKEHRHSPIRRHSVFAAIPLLDYINPVASIEIFCDLRP
jgi:hypothetical protein